MAETSTFTVTGNDPGNSFSELDLLFPGYFNPGFYGTSEETAAPVDAGTGATEAFAPPEPVLLPEIVIEPKPVPIAPPPVPTPIPTLLGAALTGLVALLFPQPTGPREFDEAPGGGGAPPPPAPPAGEDPIQPPNWWDLISEPFPIEKPLLPLLPIPTTPVEMPPGEPYFDVSPPPVTTWSPIEIPGPFTFSPGPQIIEVPFGYPDFSPDPGPGSTPAPIGTPGSDPGPGFPSPWPDFGIRVAPGPSSPTAPDVFGSPLPDFIGDPIGDPITAPPLPPAARPSPRAPTVPDLFFSDPIADLKPDPLLTEFGPTPMGPEKDVCSCAKKPKKKKKKREPRSVCYRGTYTQHAKGTTFRPIEEVPCDAPKRKAAPKKPKLKPGQFPGMGFLPGMNTEQSVDVLSDAYKQFAPIIKDYLKRKAKPKKAKKIRQRRPRTRSTISRTPGQIPDFTTSPF